MFSELHSFQIKKKNKNVGKYHKLWISMKKQVIQKIHFGIALIPIMAFCRNCTHLIFGIALMSNSELHSCQKRVKTLIIRRYRETLKAL